MQKILFALLVMMSCVAYAQETCIDPRDTFEDYDVSADSKTQVKSEFYALSYSWAPRHCLNKKDRLKQPGASDYLQCGSGRDFGYILHGLWPQGTLSQPKAYPRACQGNKPKIPRSVLNKYLCMTPSVWLLQHEYENHGTCMPEDLSSPEKYFDQALAMHKTIHLPNEHFTNAATGKAWFYANNPDLPQGSVYYDTGSQEWRICFDQAFKAMKCPGTNSVEEAPAEDGSCKIKGNISRTNKKLYFLPAHPNYAHVEIDFGAGEQCFANEAQAKNAGWKKAP
jgi:ribonuclease T2